MGLLRQCLDELAELRKLPAEIDTLKKQVGSISTLYRTRTFELNRLRKQYNSLKKLVNTTATPQPSYRIPVIHMPTCSPYPPQAPLPLAGDSSDDVCDWFATEDQSYSPSVSPAEEGHVVYFL